MDATTNHRIEPDPRLTRANREDTAKTLESLIGALRRELSAEAREGRTFECDVIHSHIDDVERVIELLTPESDR
jgi:hypothetical protein